jgi:hypothetical protein
MKALRSMLAIIAGYAVFGLSARLLFAVSGRNPHADAGFAFQMFATLYCAFFAFLAGSLAAWIAGANPMIHAGAIAFLLGTGAISSMFLSGPTGSWTMMSTILVAIPMTFVGAFAWSRYRAPVRASTGSSPTSAEQ